MFTTLYQLSLFVILPVFSFQVDLVRGQLRRATERYGGSLTPSRLSRALSQPLDKEIDPLQSRNRIIGSLHVESTGSIDHEVTEKVEIAPRTNSSKGYGSDQMIHRLERRGSSSASSDICLLNNADDGENSSPKSSEENRKPSSPVIPDDFLCPISLEVMRDPVIVATGQVKFASKLRIFLPLLPNYV